MLNQMRIGHGYDVHRLEPGHKLILGGVDIAYDTGLAGHSDADVLTHSIIDALLGASALGDIGSIFPDTDEKYKNISSLVLLEETVRLINGKYDNRCKISNIDCTIIAQKPKLSPYRENMRENLAGVLNIETGAINIKATTEEGLGFSGRSEGIASHCVCIINI